MNGKSTNATNRTSRVWPAYFIYHSDQNVTSIYVSIPARVTFTSCRFPPTVVLHEQDCIQIETIGQWPVFELQSTKNIFEDSLKNIRKTHHLNFTSFTTCRTIIFVLFAFVSPKWKPYAFTEPSLGSKLRISPEISVSVSISSPRSEVMNWSNNGCSGQWPRLTTNNAQSITVSENGSLKWHWV